MSSVKHYFFERYIPDGDSIKEVFHRHFLVVFPNLFFWLVFPIGLVTYAVYRWFYPTILGSSVLWLFEAYMFLLFFVMLYKILDWYADVWIITERGLVDVRWSIFVKDTTFMEFHDISGIQSYQGSMFDKLFDIGDLTLYKMGDEMRVARMYQPERIVKTVQASLQLHHHGEKKPDPSMHIYLDGMKQQVAPYKHGFRYLPKDASPEEDTKFLEEVRKQPGTIDLSGTPPKNDENDKGGKGH